MTDVSPMGALAASPASGWEITGSTRVFGILADPIEHVRTPQALNALMRERGVDGVMVPFHAGADDLAAVAAALNGRPRKTLGWRTPAEALDEALRSAQTGVATTS